MNKIFNKIKFLLTKPKVVIVIGQGRKAAKEAIFQVLKKHFRVGKDVFLFETEDKKINRFVFFLKNSKLPILAITDINKAYLVKNLPADIYLVLNFDNDKVREMNYPALKAGVSLRASSFGGNPPRPEGRGIPAAEMKNHANANILTFGFQEKADIWITDVNSDTNETNFKINYQGKIVPVWLAPTPNEDKSPSATKIDEASPRYGVGVGDKEQIYASVSAVAVGIILGLNLVEISQALKNYH